MPTSLTMLAAGRSRMLGGLNTASKTIVSKQSVSASQYVARRYLMQRKQKEIEEPTTPNYNFDSLQPPEGLFPPKKDTPRELDPDAYIRNPVTSAHMIDLSTNSVSELDSATLDRNNGTVKHGRYGDLGPEAAKNIPLEFLALLHPSAEATAAVRELSQGAGKGTLLVFGATQPAALSATQIASAEGHSVVAVVGGEHSGHSDMCDTVKGLTNEPGCMVPEEFALVKQKFKDLVMQVSSGAEDDSTPFDSEEFLNDFKQNLLDYIATFPDALPAAVDKEMLIFQGKEKDRKYFRDNMETYLSQFTPGAPPIPEQDLVEKFPKEQYAIFKSKFLAQTSGQISGDAPNNFNPPQIVKELVSYPETPRKQLLEQNSIEGAGDFVPYEFSVLDQKFGSGVENEKGGPIMGAIIAVTPYLQTACEALSKAKTLREKAEALQFLPVAERNAYAAASSVASVAASNGGKVLVVGGSLPGMETVTPTDSDVKAAISSMDIDDDGSCKLNHFVQVYRAGDFPVYADYAVHKATEVLPGPRSIIVTK